MNLKQKNSLTFCQICCSFLKLEERRLQLSPKIGKMFLTFVILMAFFATDFDLKNNFCDKFIY